MSVLSILTDPLKFVALNWPDIVLYDKQAEIMESVRDNFMTIVPAGHKLGKDFISGLTALWFFCSRSPCRVVTSSVDHSQLKGVLWGEIRRFISTSKYRLPIQQNDLLIRQQLPDGELEPRSYLIGRVTKAGEGMQGHHLEQYAGETTGIGVPRTLAIFDEASGIDNKSFEAATTWAHRLLIIGNCYTCSNLFYQGTLEGDQKAV